MKARIEVTLKESVLDPQGQAIGQALHHLGFDKVESVRQGKLIELELNETDAVKAKEMADAMAKKLLANEVIETYSILLDEAA